MLKIDRLTIEYQVHPIGIVEQHPRFAWSFQPGDHLFQLSYRLLVASRPEWLEPGKADLWDSTRVISDAMTGIPYEGTPLVSRQLCHVACLIEDQNGEFDRTTGSFEMGLMNQEDFHGHWVSIPNNFQGSTLYFRKKLDLSKAGLVRARAYICGIGYHELYVNGRKVTDRVLNPGLTDYAQTLLYDIYDIAEAMEEKDNVIGIEVGYGWLGSRKMLAQFYFDYADGTVIEDYSTCNHGWWVSGSPVLDNSIYGGETYDARLERRYGPGWARREFEPTWDNGWMYTILTQAPQGKLVPQLIEPIRVLGDYPEKTRTRISDQIWVFDIGQNLAGWAKIVVRGEKGAKLTLKYAEGICPDGTVNQLNLRSAPCTDAYILRGEGIETYAPRFTYHGFQYVQAELEGCVEILSLTGQHVHTDIHRTGSFECSDAVLNRLHQNAVITEENNVHSILTDCPQRDERFGWLNDLSSRTYQTVYNFRMDRLFPKIARDIEQTQDPQGAIADTAPYYTGGRPADLTTVSFLLLGLHSYHYYGDLSLIRERYAGFRKWVDYLLTRQNDYIMDYYYYADWCAPAGFADSKTDNIYVSTVFLFWHLRVLARLAEIAGFPEDQQKYAAMAEASRRSINRHYYHSESGNYSTGTQCENAFALNLDIAEPSERAKIAENIAKDMRRHGNHCTCGNQGYRHVFYAMSDEGYIDDLVTMIKNPEYPGWGYMLACGATTVWERWESKMENIMHSFDHPMFGSYDAWFYRYFAGIRIGDEAAVKSLTIKPYLPQGITFVNCGFESVRGRIESNWIRTPHGAIHTIVIPPNTEAHIDLPFPVVTINGKRPAWIDGSQKFRLDSGTYVIETKEN